MVLGETVNENWAVTISNIGVEELRYRIPKDMKSDNIVLYVKDADGNWREQDFTVIGSYLAFDFMDGDQGFALYEASNMGVGIVLAVAAVVLVMIGAFMIRKKKTIKGVK